MKKMTSLFLMLGLTFSLHLTANLEQQYATHQKVDQDGYTIVSCQLRPFERKSRTQSNVHCPHFEAEFNSLNWSGYSAFTGTTDEPNPTYGSVTKVSGSWTVPTVTVNEGGDTFSAAWVGIDGYSAGSTTVEQIGTEHDVIDGVPVYLAWFEMYPAASQIIDGMVVKPGDIMEAKVVYQGQNDDKNDIFKLEIKNHTTKQTFSIVQATFPGYPAHLSSANWIVEAPATVTSGCGDPTGLAVLPLSTSTPILFNQCEAVINGKKGSIDNHHWTYDSFTMVSNTSEVKATPSALSKSKCPHKNKKQCKGNRFSVVFNSSGPFPYDCIDPR